MISLVLAIKLTHKTLVLDITALFHQFNHNDKISVAFFFLSLSPFRCLRWAAIITGFISLLVGLLLETYHIFVRHPTKYYWERYDITTVHKGSCPQERDGSILLQLINGFDGVSDVILAVLLTLMVWKLAIQRPQKVAIAFLLGLGALPAIATFNRGYSLTVSMRHPADYTYWGYSIAILCVVEPGVAITVICVAQLKPLLVKIKPGRWHYVADVASEENVTTIGRAYQKSQLQDLDVISTGLTGTTNRSADQTSLWEGEVPTLHHQKLAYTRKSALW